MKNKEPPKGDILKLQRSLRDKCSNCGTKEDVYFSNLLDRLLCEKCENELIPF